MNAIFFSTVRRDYNSPADWERMMQELTSAGLCFIHSHLVEHEVAVPFETCRHLSEDEPEFEALCDNITEMLREECPHFVVQDAWFHDRSGSFFPYMNELDDMLFESTSAGHDPLDAAFDEDFDPDEIDCDIDDDFDTDFDKDVEFDEIDN